MPIAINKIEYLFVMTLISVAMLSFTNAIAEPPEPCVKAGCHTESETSEVGPPHIQMRPMLSKRDNLPKPLPFAPLTGQATIQSPTNSQIVGETFRIQATLPSDWFLSGVARGRIFYFDVSADRFVVVSEFAVPAIAGQDMQSLEDKSVDFETTVPESASHLYTFEISQAAPPEGFRPYNISTFIEVRPGMPVCFNRYCLEKNIDAFEASLSDLKLNMSEPSDPLSSFDNTTYKRQSHEEFGMVQEWIDIPNAFKLVDSSFDLTYSQSIGSLASLSLVNRLYDVRRKECKAHFVGIASKIEAKFGTLLSDKRWTEWSRLRSESDFGASSQYATYKEGKEFTYSAVRRVANTHNLSINTTYTNENGYIACISRVDIEPVIE